MLLQVLVLVIVVLVGSLPVLGVVLPVVLLGFEALVSVQVVIWAQGLDALVGHCGRSRRRHRVVGACGVVGLLGSGVRDGVGCQARRVGGGLGGGGVLFGVAVLFGQVGKWAVW